MKKFFAILLVALFGAMPLFADDVADVKEVIRKDYEMGMNFDLSGVLALRTPDYQGTLPDGTLINYEMAKLMCVALDGKHPEEFLLFTLMAQGVTPTEEMKAKIRENAKSPELVKEYETMVIPMMRVLQKIGMGLVLKTMKFVSVDVNGDNATVVYESLTIDKNADIRDATGTTTLRRVNGAWLICRSVAAYK